MNISTEQYNELNSFSKSILLKFNSSLNPLDFTHSIISLNENFSFDDLKKRIKSEIIQTVSCNKNFISYENASFYKRNISYDKVCTICHELKPINCFDTYLNRGVTYYRNWCTTCYKQYYSKKRENPLNKQYQKEYWKTYYSKLKNKPSYIIRDEIIRSKRKNNINYKEYQKEYHKKYYLNNKSKFLKKSGTTHRKYKKTILLLYLEYLIKLN